MSDSDASLRPARFAIDGLDGTYDGFTTGETWNGWAVPYFPPDEARRIADDYAAQPPGPDGPGLADYDADLIRLYEPSNDEWEDYGPVEIEGKMLYEIGARYWTWGEVEGI